MPIYEYQCKKCHHKFEKIQKFSDPKIKKCPECGGPVEQNIHAPAVHFKGSGFYATDYAKTSGKEDASSAKGESSGSGKESDNKDKSGASEAKTESKKTESKESKKHK